MASGENEIVISYFTNGADNSVLAKTIPNSYVSNYIRVTIAPVGRVLSGCVCVWCVFVC